MESFGDVLRRYRERSGLSQLGLAKRSGVHASIINRFERDERRPADRETIERLTRALGLSMIDGSVLLAAGGFFPEPIARLGAADPDLLLLADILADETAPEAERQELRQALRIIAKRWRPDGIGLPACLADSAQAPPAPARQRRRGRRAAQPEEPATG